MEHLKYLSMLSYHYEYLGDKHHRSRYIRFRTNCPYFVFCVIFRHLGESLTPIEIFGDDCKCHSCYLSCDKCGKTVKTFSNHYVPQPELGSKEVGQMIVHHYDYNTPANSKPDWYKSYGILCVSCNIKDGQRKVEVTKC